MTKRISYDELKAIALTAPLDIRNNLRKFNWEGVECTYDHVGRVTVAGHYLLPDCEAISQAISDKNFISIGRIFPASAYDQVSDTVKPTDTISYNGLVGLLDHHERQWHGGAISRSDNRKAVSVIFRGHILFVRPDNVLEWHEDPGLFVVNMHKPKEVSRDWDKPGYDDPLSHGANVDAGSVKRLLEILGLPSGACSKLSIDFEASKVSTVTVTYEVSKMPANAALVEFIGPETAKFKVERVL